MDRGLDAHFVSYLEILDPVTNLVDDAAELVAQYGWKGFTRENVWSVFRSDEMWPIFVFVLGII